MTRLHAPPLERGPGRDPWDDLAPLGARGHQAAGVLRRAGSGLSRASRFVGPHATEVHVLARADPVPRIEDQVSAIYGELASALFFEGVPPESVVRETVFFRDIDRDLHTFASARRRALAQAGVGASSWMPAASLIGQPPASTDGVVEVLVTAVAPHHRPERWRIERPAMCRCEPCGQAAAHVVRVKGENHIWAGDIVGVPGDPYEETLGMLRSAEELLAEELGSFRSVVRTWFWFRDIDRDYAAFNRARRDYFRRAGIATPPASTGIGGAPFVSDHAMAMGFHAIVAPRDIRAERMTSWSLNEAPEYGSDFSRGLAIDGPNQRTLHVSGTASIDESGRTKHAGDIDAQARRMLLNVSALLAGQGATFADAISAVTYVKRPQHVRRVLSIYETFGLEELPHAIVQADICRPDLLCELEITAALPPRPPESDTGAAGAAARALDEEAAS